MDVQDHVGQANAVQALEDGVDGGALLGHEEHLLVARQQARDQVGDRLALARARRSLDDQILAGKDAIDGLVLAGVGVEDQEFVVRRRRVGKDDGARGRFVAMSQRRPGGRIAGHRRQQVVRLDRRVRALDVAHHRQLRVEEIAEDRAVGHREAADAVGLEVQPVVGRGDFGAGVDRAVELGQERLGVDRPAEVGPEAVQQQRVDFHLARRLELEIVLRSAAWAQLRRPQEDR